MEKFKTTLVYGTAAAVIFVFTTFATQAYVREYVGLKFDNLCSKIDYIVKSVDEIKTDLKQMKK